MAAYKNLGNQSYRRRRETHLHLAPVTSEHHGEASGAIAGPVCAAHIIPEHLLQCLSIRCGAESACQAVKYWFSGC